MKTLRVSAAEMGPDWPLTVDAGELRCLPPGAVVIRVGTQDYAVNGLTMARGFASIDPIWAVATTSPRKDLSPLILRGLALMAREEAGR